MINIHNLKFKSWTDPNVFIYFFFIIIFAAAAFRRAVFKSKNVSSWSPICHIWKLSATSQDGRKIRENKKGKRDCVEAISSIIANFKVAKKCICEWIFFDKFTIIEKKNFCATFLTILCCCCRDIFVFVLWMSSVIQITENFPDQNPFEIGYFLTFQSLP